MMGSAISRTFRLMPPPLFVSRIPALLARALISLLATYSVRVDRAAGLSQVFRISGTSAGTPSFAGVMSLVDQKTGGVRDCKHRPLSPRSRRNVIAMQRLDTRARSTPSQPACLTMSRSETIPCRCKAGVRLADSRREPDSIGQQAWALQTSRISSMAGPRSRVRRQLQL